MTDPEPLLTLADFSPLVGQRFVPADAPDAVPFMLVAASALDTYDYPGRQREPFVLTFESETPRPEQGLREFDTPTRGRLSIFLVPIEQRGDVAVYEAVFN